MAYGHEQWQRTCGAAIPQESAVGDLGNSMRLKRHKIINRKLVDAATKGGVVAVLNLVLQELPSMNGVNLATALHRIARLCMEGVTDPNAAAPHGMLQDIEAHPAFSLLLQAVEVRAEAALAEPPCAADPEEALPAQCTSIVAWSLASLNLCNLYLLELLAKLAAPRLDEFQFYEVTNMLWAYARLGVAGHFPALTGAIALRLKGRRWGEFKAHCLCLAAWSFAKAGWEDVGLLGGIADEVCGNAEMLKSESISNICYASAKLKLVHQRLMKAVALVVVSGRCLQRIQPQELCNILRAFAVGGQPLRGFFEKAGAAAVRLARVMEPSHVITVLEAYAKTKSSECPDLVPTLLNAAASRIQLYTPEEMVVATKLAVTLCPGHRIFFQACAGSAVSRLAQFGDCDLSHLVEHLSRANPVDASSVWTMTLLQEQQKRALGSPVPSTVASRTASVESDGGSEPGASAGEDVSGSALFEAHAQIEIQSLKEHSPGAGLLYYGTLRHTEQEPWNWTVQLPPCNSFRPPPGLELPAARNKQAVLDYAPLSMRNVIHL